MNLLRFCLVISNPGNRLEGFSLGDELGFGQSLSNLEGNKRRSTNGRTAGIGTFLDTDNSVGKKAESGRMYQGPNTRPSLPKSIKMPTIPPFKPIPPAEKSVSLKPLGYPAGLNVTGTRPLRQPSPFLANPIPGFQTLPSSISRIHSSVKAPHVFKNALQQATNNFGMQSSVSNYLQTAKLSHRTPLVSSSGPQVISVVQAQPQALAQVQYQVSSGIDRVSSNSAPVPVKLLPTAIPVSNSVTTEKTKFSNDESSFLMSDTVKTLSQATNVSAEAIAAAIAQKQQQLFKEQKTQKIIRTTSTTTTTTTERSSPDNIRKYPLAAPSRVMNAPREYYPVGYEKNFDDNFVSRVELPETSFYCGEQKHFPGLYADEDLGCMVST
ncbi:hypothetical protein RUM44_013532 [Polyplax serrata]|uniref:Uncharacterized protein n=1 Tax=Polyplax serrata TaxID=468196 RepID=A0ABR1BGM4_POLSC